MSSFLDDAIEFADRRVATMIERSGGRGFGGEVPTPSFLPGAAGGGVGPNLGILDANRDTAKAAEQYKAFRDWVYACVRPIATRIAGQPVRVAKLTRRDRLKAQRGGLDCRDTMPRNLKAYTQNFDAELLDDHEIIRTLDDPNAIMVRWALFFVTVAGLEMTGKAFWWLHPRDKQAVREGAPATEIWPIPATWVEPVHTEGRLYAEWKIRPEGSGEPFTVPGEQIVYYYYPHFTSPMAALSPLQAGSRAVAADSLLLEAQTRGLRNGSNPGVILTVGRNPDIPGVSGGASPRMQLTPVQRAQIIHTIKAYYRGVTKQDEPLILDNMIEKAEPFGRSNAEMAYRESGEPLKERISQTFGTNPIIMGQIQNANRASATVADDIFCANTVNPKIELISECATAWLAPRFSKKSERLLVYIEPATSYDPDMVLKKVLAMYDRQMLNVNEGRQILLGLPPVVGGHVVMARSGLVPIELIAEGGEQPDPGEWNPFIDGAGAAEEDDGSQQPAAGADDQPAAGSSEGGADGNDQE